MPRRWIDVQAVSRMDLESANRATFYAGREQWPFPAGPMRSDRAWSFDSEGARDEVLMRRIGQHELAVIDVMRQAGELQATYSRNDHDDDGPMGFAAPILRRPGARDGLFWPDERLRPRAR